jgi:hypothetical protein
VTGKNYWGGLVVTTKAIEESNKCWLGWNGSVNISYLSPVVALHAFALVLLVFKWRCTEDPQVDGQEKKSINKLVLAYRVFCFSCS